MATGLLIVAILAAIALTFWRPFRRLRSALGLGHLVSTGHAFLVIGFVVGMLVDEDPSLTESVAPVVAFFAGWVGFAAGVRFDGRVLRNIPRRAFGVALAPAVAAALIVGGASAGVLYYAGVPPRHVVTGATLLAAAAATSGPTLVAGARTRRAGRAFHARPVLRMIEFSAGIDVVVVAFLAVVVFAFLPDGLAPIWLVAAALFGGALLGGITWLFLGGRASEDERLLLGLAMMMFTAGFAGWLRLSPAATGAMTAVTLVNLPGDRMTQLVRIVRRVERPAVVVLMTVIGFQVAGELSWIFWPMLAGMTLLRLGVMVTAGDRVSGTISGAGGLHATRSWGLGRAPQGILGLVVALSYFYVAPDPITRSLLAAIAVGSLANELAAPPLLLRLLREVASRPGQVRPGGARSS